MPRQEIRLCMQERPSQLVAPQRDVPQHDDNVPASGSCMTGSPRTMGTFVEPRSSISTDRTHDKFRGSPAQPWSSAAQVVFAFRMTDAQ